MKTFIQLAVVMSALILVSATPDGQRRRQGKGGKGGKGGGSMFADFHKKAAFKLGSQAPALHAKDTEGVELDIAEYRGQWVFIEFGSYT
ncbi:MAG: hypothetical protein ACYTDT_02170 [Planctomycetota bacterium]|jgi:hypothetical protein